MANTRVTTATGDEVQQVNDGAQPESVNVEAQQPVEIADSDIIDAPFGARVRSGTGRNRHPGAPPEPRENTYVSGVNAGAHLNIYLSASLYTVATPRSAAVCHPHDSG